MSDIASIDKNFQIQAKITKTDIKFYDVREEPFKVYGLYDYKNEPIFTRMPDAVASTVNDGVKELAFHTAGGRVRFCTDSPYIAIRAFMNNVTHFEHMTLIGTSGFDLYMDENGGSTFCGSFSPSTRMTQGYEAIKEFAFKEKKMRYYTINFPLYNTVTTLYIGLQEGAKVEAGKEYTIKTPIVYYGSSITQGGCVSRPGNCYESIISRKYDCDYINLGFSGSGRGEKEIVDYMSGLDMSIFVSDYDHNAQGAAHLSETVRNMYKTMRAAKPDLPMIFISRPDFDKPLYSGERDSVKRRNAIYQMYIEAFDAGDENIHFIDGESIFDSEYRDGCTVDLTHPNDLGHTLMANTIGCRIGAIIKKFDKNK